MAAEPQKSCIAHQLAAHARRRRRSAAPCYQGRCQVSIPAEAGIRRGGECIRADTPHPGPL